jgi:hypothetical protein
MFSLTKKIITYIKDEGFNLQTCVNALTSIISCSILPLLKILFGAHTFKSMLIHHYKWKHGYELGANRLIGTPSAHVCDCFLRSIFRIFS